MERKEKGLPESPHRIGWTTYAASYVFHWLLLQYDYQGRERSVGWREFFCLASSSQNWWQPTGCCHYYPLCPKCDYETDYGPHCFSSEPFRIPHFLENDLNLDHTNLAKFGPFYRGRVIGFDLKIWSEGRLDHSSNENSDLLLGRTC